MVVQDKKIEEIRICVDLRKLNDVCLMDPFPTSFPDKVLNNVGGHEAYSFTDGFYGYHQIRIAKEDRHKTTFATKKGCYQYMVMLFGLKNAPTIFSGWLSSLSGNLSISSWKCILMIGPCSGC